jgi:hypothetical protein
VIPFSLGVAAGSLIAQRVLKTKYEQLAQDEIDSYKAYVKEKYSTKPEEEIGEDKKSSMVTRDDPCELSNLLGQYRSTNERRTEEKRKEEDKQVSKPHVITLEEYNDHELDYDFASLNYYADGVLTDEWDTVIKNTDEIVGEDALTALDTNPECDSIYVRNDDLKCYYEILRDTQTYAEAVGVLDDPSDTEG